MDSRSPSASPSYAIEPERLQQSVDALVQLIKQHFEKLPQLPVKPSLKPGEVAAKFAAEIPEQSLAWDTILSDIRDKILPAVTHWQHPRFFAYYPCSSSLPAMLSELLIAAIGSVGLQWSANPAATELECLVMDWIMQMLGAPEHSPFLHRSRQGGGIIQNSAGEAMAVIMVAARIHKQSELSGYSTERAPDPLALEQLYWQDSSQLVVYMSDHTHFSGPKAVRVAGMRLHKLAAQKLAHGNFGISKEQVREAMAHDRAQGLVPCAVLLNYGSTNTCGYDDLAAFSGFAAEENVWVHVDAAYAGSSLILPEFRERSLTLQAIAIFKRRRSRI